MSTCLICLEHITHPIDLHCHQNQLCYSCFKSHVQESIRSGTYQALSSIKCPVCTDKAVMAEQIVPLLNPDDQELIQEAMLKVYLRQTKDIHRCPLSTCTYAAIQPESCLFSKQTECPLCYSLLNKKFSFDIITPIITLIYLTFFTNNCPKCEVPIERISGCHHITCTCRHQFCWFCRKDYNHSGNTMYLKHESVQCLSFFIIRAVTLLFVLFSLILAVQGVAGFDSVVKSLGGWLLFILKIIAVDGVITAQVIIMMRLYHYYWKQFRIWVVIFSCADILILSVLGYFGLMEGVLHIFGISAVIGLIGVAIGFLVVFTWKTWFQYII